jgi:trans-2,3-dihydro-3-hydroxyanthranilate isomerase
MFAPISGTIEDPATGSACSTLGALLVTHSTHERRAFEIVQGVEMGRPSALDVRAWRAEDGVHASVAGRCVDVLHGEATV